MRSTHTVGLSDARRIIDAGGSLAAHVRMDRAQLGSIKHSIEAAAATL